jgi:hypothetical protein
MRATARTRRAVDAKKAEPTQVPALLVAPASSSAIGETATPPNEWRH